MDPTAPLDPDALRMLRVTPTIGPTPPPPPYAQYPLWFQDWAPREQACAGTGYRTGKTVLIDTAWHAMLGLYTRMHYGEISALSWPTSCEARTYTYGTCLHQAIAGYGLLRNDYGIGDEQVFITVYEWCDGGSHAIVTVRTAGDLWLFDRNYGPNYPHMPMRERDFLRLYKGCGRMIYRFSMWWYDGLPSALVSFFDWHPQNLR